MKQTIVEVRQRLADPDHVPRPVQQPIPVLVGAMSREGLAVAVDHADIIGYSALRHTQGKPPGTLRAATAEETDELVTFVRDRANGRPIEADVLIQAVELGRDPLRVAKAFVEREAESEDPRVLVESPMRPLRAVRRGGRRRNRTPSGALGLHQLHDVRAIRRGAGRGPTRTCRLTVRRSKPRSGRLLLRAYWSSFVWSADVGRAPVWACPCRGPVLDQRLPTFRRGAR